MKIHLDTDLGGDIDDLAALALLLKWPGLEITGITTVAEEDGRRAGYVHHALRLAGRDDIPVAAGADASHGQYRYTPTYPPERAFWPEPVAPEPGPVEAALELLKASIEQGAAVIGIGPCTNLALLDRRFPGILQQASVTLVGGWVFPPRPTRSAWGNEVDYNFQFDVDSTLHIVTHCRPTLVPLHVTVETTLRHADLPRLRDGGPLAALLARQAVAYDEAGEFEQLDRESCSDLPPDFINHLYDPLGCAVALGWDGVEIEAVPLRFSIEDGWLHERVDAEGIRTRVVTAVDGPGFDRLWLESIVGERTGGSCHDMPPATSY